ncbi:MAG: hypothetical protein M3323_15605 [Actinomycetota bacterium]|nr:hypothetical protein [Actinomycetota bacterium]
MDLQRRLEDLAAARRRTVPPLSAIEARAGRLRARAMIAGVVAVAAVVAAASAILVRLDANPTLSPGTQGRGAVVPTTEPSTAGGAACELGDGCASENEKLAGDEEWLGNRLKAADLEYVNAYRPDGGGGHVNRRWGFQIWVLRPQRETPEQEAARWEYQPLWRAGEVTIFGRARSASPTAYFYWRAGDVDTFVELDWPGSIANDVDDLRGVFSKVIAEQERQPYPHGP